MAGSMSEEDLVADLKSSLQDSASVFTAAGLADFKRHLKAAALAFSSKKRRTLLGSLTLVADQSAYDPPADFMTFKHALWGINSNAKPKPWEKRWPGVLPSVTHAETETGKKLCLDPAPSAAQISTLGSEFKFYYFAQHVIHATDGAQTSILAGDRGILVLRAQAEAMRELAARNAMKPVTLREGISNLARNGTPTYLYESLLKEFNELAV